ncbi:MAG: hypothetical protein H0U45_15575 [Tatlockia sp.]|nr:hypothetical protein [Tatlockia sp.]
MFSLSALLEREERAHEGSVEQEYRRQQTEQTPRSLNRNQRRKVTSLLLKPRPTATWYASPTVNHSLGLLCFAGSASKYGGSSKVERHLLSNMIYGMSALRSP